MRTTPDYISSPEAAAILGISARTVHRIVASGDLVPVMTAPGGAHGAFLFDPADVERLAAARVAGDQVVDADVA